MSGLGTDPAPPAESKRNSAHPISPSSNHLRRSWYWTAWRGERSLETGDGIREESSSISSLVRTGCRGMLPVAAVS